MRPLAALALLVAGCVPLGSSSSDAGGINCPAIACGASYQVDFARSGAWGPGRYRIDVTADGAASACEIVIPMTCDHPPRCQGNPSWLPSAVGCALDPSQQKLGGVVFDRTMPASVTVGVSLDDRSLGMRTFTPTYRTTTTHGGCLTCTQAPAETLILTQ